MLYSHSRLSTFESCPLKFRFYYLDKVDAPSEEGVEAFLGSRVHDTLEKLYKDLKFTKENSLADLLDYYNKIWIKNWHDGVKIVRKDYTGDHYRGMGEKFLTDYYNRFKPFDQEETIAIEKRIVLNLDSEGKYQLQGYIDRIGFKDDMYYIIDYKTNSNLPDEKYLKEDRQLAIYSIALKEMYQDCKKVKLRWHFLAFDKVMEVEKTCEDLDELKKNTVKLIQKIESAKEFPSKVSALCDWCQYRSICPEWKHKYQLDEKSPEDFKKDDGVKLIDDYSKFKADEKDIAQKIEELKERILKFAKKEDVAAVYGSDARVKIWSKEVSKFPRKNDPDNGALKIILKEVGLYDKFSTIDNWDLEKAYESGDLPEDLMKKLEKLAHKEKLERLYLANLTKED